mmetsp:Transcript_20397/g.33649  ORF Transcript_20397/g.33649 Transcript_20397/m.33649 type:complete len:209 (+) Transcript_20397:209-835(+)
METDSTVTAPEGFRLLHNVVGDGIWEKLEEWLSTDCVPWQNEGEKMQHRNVAQFGCRYNYETDELDMKEKVIPIPEIIKETLLDVELSTLEGVEFTQCIINDYKTGDIVIPWHKDHPSFGPTILVYTFCDERVLDFRRKCTEFDNTSYEYYSAFPKHGSMYILQGAARYEWEHCVPQGKGRRISFTFRSLQKGNLYPLLDDGAPVGFE